MHVTTYGYQIPDTGDPAKGATGWMQAVTANFNRLDGHNHDGNNSVLLSLSSFAPFSNTIAAAGWGASGAGFKQTVTVPAGVTEINNYNVKFIFTAPSGVLGQTAYLGYKRLTATTYEVYCNDNTAALTALYR